MLENEETSSSERVKGDEYVLKKANQTNLKEEENKGTTVKVDIKEDATSEELYYPTTCVTPLLYTCTGVM
jgi:hypothetical protein